MNASWLVCCSLNKHSFFMNDSICCNITANNAQWPWTMCFNFKLQTTLLIIKAKLSCLITHTSIRLFQINKMLKQSFAKFALPLHYILWALHSRSRSDSYESSLFSQERTCLCLMHHSEPGCTCQHSELPQSIWCHQIYLLQLYLWTNNLFPFYFIVSHFFQQ